jgi:NTP pyrophosphatase (non-canonical NTP hydrolase)
MPTSDANILDLGALQQRLRQFSDERNWEPFQTPKNLAMAMMVEAAELVEIFQWLTPEQSSQIAANPAVQQHVGEEIADVIVYLVQIAQRCGVDIPAAIDRKIGLNAVKYPAAPR